MGADRILIVNADDFGRSPGVNRGVARAHESGIVTSASLMVRWPAAVEAAAYADAHPALSLGIHVDLAEWTYVDGDWRATYIVADDADTEAVADELDRQLSAFRRLSGRDPTHIDSHQHVHRPAEANRVFVDRAHRLGIPLREGSAGIAYCGDFFGQSGHGDPYPEGITVETLIAILESLPLGVTELACHPGLGDDVDSPYRTERSQEVQTLCDDRVRQAIRTFGVELRSFREVELAPGSSA